MPRPQSSVEFDAPAIRALRERILPWYVRHRRDLPWRVNPEPYGVVVAEMMLQQTGVERVAPRWRQFLQRFPSWRELAAASVGDVIREWQGLGYNRRAVNLHRLACHVVDELGGVLPDERTALLKLPGIGPYTADAILSFVHGRDVATIDVNLKRVIGRVALGDEAPTERELRAVAEQALPAGRSSDWNQALMDFASRQCTLRRPICHVCPLRDACCWAGSGSADGAAPPLELTSPPIRRVAERQAPYVGSTRFIRGRILDVLRCIEGDTGITAAEITERLDGIATAEEATVARLLPGLVRDGLVAGIEESKPPRYRLP